MFANKQTHAAKFLVFSTFLFGLPIVAFADSTPSVAQMLMNFSETIPNFMSLVTAIAYVLGMWLVFKGIMGLKQYGEQRTMMSSSHNLKGPLVSMTIGAFLLYLPSSVTTGFNTFWTEPNPYGYVNTAADQYSIIVRDCYMVVQLIGTIAFIRGLLTLNQLGHQSAQPNTFSKGITYIISGVFCINLYDFLNAVRGTLGIM